MWELVKLNFKNITTALMIIFIVALIVILVKYFSTPLDQSKRYNEIVNNNNFSTNSDVNHIISDKISGETFFSGDISGELVSGESGDYSGEEVKTPSKTNTSKKNDSPVIISSESTMTNKEKREILTELDSTLKELLDVVDKVKTVDETRLTTNESEVQEWKNLFFLS